MNTVRTPRMYQVGGRGDGDPTKKDTARLVNASQAQIQQLIDAGYLPYKSENLALSKERDTNVVEADRGFFASDSIDIEDVLDAMIKKPHLAQYAASVISDVSSKHLDIPNDFFEDYLKAVDRVINDITPREGDASFSTGHRRGMSDSAVEALDIIKEERRRIEAYLSSGSKDANDKARAFRKAILIGLRLASAAKGNSKRERYLANEYSTRNESSRITKYGDDVEGLNKKLDEYAQKITDSGIKNEQRHKANLMDLVGFDYVSPNIVDPDEYLDLALQGFDNPIRVGEYSLLNDLGKVGSAVTQMPKALYNLGAWGFDKIQDSISDEEVAPNDLGTRTTNAGPDLYDINIERPDGNFVSMKGLYPTKRHEYGPWRTVRDFTRESTDAREDLDRGFYLDREKAGTGAVTNEELTKTLFNEKIDPNRRVQFYNEALGDLVDVYLYDDPEMLKTAGLKESLVPRNFRVIGAKQQGDTEQPTSESTDPVVPVNTPPARPRPKNIKPLESRPPAINVIKDRDLVPASPVKPPTGRRVVPVGVVDQTREGSRTGQKLDREYYWDPAAKKYKQRVVDEERRGGKIYLGHYSFEDGGSMKTVKKPNYYQMGGIGDPKKAPAGKVAALDANDRLIYVDDPSLGHAEGDSLDTSALKRGVSYAESIGGELMINPNSSATGLYGQLFSELQKQGLTGGMSREQFAADTAAQNRIFDVRLNEGIGGPSLMRNAYELTEEYASQLGDKWNFSLDEVAAISNYLGRDGARKYFASIRDGVPYKVSGVNKPVEEYLQKYRLGRDR